MFSIATLPKPMEQSSAENIRERTGHLSRKVVLIRCALFLVGLFYLAQLFTPLRLDTDSVVFLLMAASGADGHGFHYHGHAVDLPVGYPGMVAVMNLLGLGFTGALVALNAGLLAGGLLAARAIFRETFRCELWKSELLVLVTLLSFVLVKHFPLTTSDVPYLGISMISLWLMVKSGQTEARIRFVYLALGAALAVLALLTRTVGVTLLAPLFLAIARQRFGTLKISTILIRYKYLFGMAAVGSVVAAMVVFPVAVAFRIKDAIAAYASTGFLHSIEAILWKRPSEWGVVFLNIPPLRLPAQVQLILPVFGVLLGMLVVFGIWVRRKEAGPLELYFAAYVGILCIWPSLMNARFWVPMLPLLAAWAAVGLGRLVTTPARKLALLIYLCWFGGTGMASLVYSTRISLSGKAFPDRYGDGTYRGSYRMAFDHDPKAPGANRDVVDVLRRYEPRAR